MNRTLAPRLSSWDLCLARRAASVGGVVCVLTLVVVAATDAGGPWPTRLGMTAALAPLAGALGALAAQRRASGGGELLALAALGVDPARAIRGAAVGGIVVGAIGVLVAASPLADLASLFPIPGSARWVLDASGARELTTGVTLSGGHLTLGVPAAPAAFWAPPPLPFTLAALATATVACPAWAATPGSSTGRRALVLAVSLLAAIVSFQVVATHLAPAWSLLLGPALILADLVASGLFSRRATLAAW